MEIWANEKSSMVDETSSSSDIIELPDDMDPIEFTDDPDPVDVLLRFAQRMMQRPSRKFPITQDRDRLFVTILLAILADPHHHLNDVITRPLLKVYLERGGKVYRRGVLSRFMREPDQFDHTVQYLYDYGLPIVEIARAMGTVSKTIRKHLKYLRDDDPLDETEC